MSTSTTKTDVRRWCAHRQGLDRLPPGVLTTQAMIDLYNRHHPDAPFEGLADERASGYAAWSHSNPALAVAA